MRRTAFVVLLICLVAGSPVFAEDLATAVRVALEKDSLMKASDAELESARLQERAAFGEMFPTLQFDAEYGSGTFDRDWDDDEFDTEYNQSNVRLVQPITAFGTERAQHRGAKFSHQRSCADNTIVRQDLILECATAYLRLKQAEKEVQYAKDSVANIKKQTEMEDARVAMGKGVSTDVLQAKTQLLRAQARLTRAEGRLVGAQNRAERVFSRSARIVSSLQKVDLAAGKIIPTDLKKAEAAAFESSPHLKAAGLAARVAEASLSAVRYDNYLPKVNGVLEADWKDDFGGVQGDRTEMLAKIEVLYEFNVGLSGVNGTKSARQKLIASEERLLDTRRRVVEQVRNAWQNLRTAKETTEILRNQTALASKFLELARKERKLGKRSLLDVLNGETTLINAQSEAASAEADVEIFTYQLLRAIGVLDVPAKKSK